MKYKLLSGQHGRFEKGQQVVYRKDDEIDLTKEEAEYLGARVEKVSGAAEAPAPTPAKAAAAGSLGLADVNMPDAVDKVAKLDTAEALDAAEAEEKAGKDRKGVHEAIDDRRAELAEK